MSSSVTFTGVQEPQSPGTPSRQHRVVRFAANSQLFAQGTPANEAYRVISGSIQLIRNSGLRKFETGRLGPGSVAGYNEVILDSPYFTSARAGEDTQVEVLTADDLQQSLRATPPEIQGVMRQQAEQQQRLFQMAESPVVEQTFLGLCKGIEFVLPHGGGPQPESTVVAKLRDLFGLPTPVIQQALGMLSDLNLLTRVQKGAMEATLEVSHDKVMERARGLIDRWLHTLPDVLRREAPREPYSLQDLADELEVESQTIVRRIMGNDFPKNILMFDAKGVEGVLQVYGPGFFKQKVTSRDLIDDAQSLDELMGIDLAMMKNFVPNFDFRRLCQMLTRATEDVKTHILAALPPRMRRIAKAEVAQLSAIAETTFADIESDFMELARESLSRR